ncbi:MAG: alanine racemase [Candidatus Cloacimonetes bacterium]|nr:alanine racemase [Candidatus Cloacimonadota bacterium]
MLSSSWIELDASAVAKNIRYLTKRIRPAQFVSVIKGNAYGHGIDQFIPLAERAGVSYFAVYDAQEAAAALKVKDPSSQLLIMGVLDDDQLDWIIGNGIEFYVFTLGRLTAAIQMAKKLKRKAIIHLELETGMNRTGFEEAEFPELIELLKQNRRHLCLKGICTHYAGAESVANYFRIQNQLQTFLRLKKELKKSGIAAQVYHSACSAAALIYPHTIMDMVRFGIAQYGFWPSMETKMNNLLSPEVKFTRDPLKTVLSWKTRVMSVKSVAKGNFINYGNNFLSTKNMKLATIPVGYHQGYAKNLSYSGLVLLRGKRAPVVGSINMNMFMVDVTHIHTVAPGDEVVLIGKQGDLAISVASFAELTKVMNYELLARLPQQIPRVVV